MIALEHLTKVYGHGRDTIRVLDDLDFRVQAGEIFAVVGASGAGKSTLAQCVALLEEPTSGRVVVNGEELTGLPEHRLRVARRRIGSIFQSPCRSSTWVSPAGPFRPAWRSCSTGSASHTGPAPTRTSCRGASGNGSGSPAPSP
jgi:ABC-type oligopeptide transport system ATPase subunit